MRTYKVTCLNCENTDTVGVDDNNHIVFQYGKGVNTNFTAARWRPDNSWGWECVCGNYDLLAEEEKPKFKELVSGAPMRLEQIASMLKVKNRKAFIMETA